MSHTCQAAVIHCIDFRFQKAIADYLEQAGVVSYDRISVAGAAKNIAIPENDAEKAYVLNQIDISVRLHEVKEIILIHHEDCGAYGGKSTFASDEVEHDTHFEHMDSVRRMLASIYQDVVVKLVYAKFDGDQIIFEEEV